VSRLAPVDRRILALALPALGSLAVEPLYVLTDTAIVGRLGTDQLAGLAIAASVLGIVFGGANFLTYGATERVARRIGAGDQAGAADVGVQTMWLAALVGVVVAPLLAVLARPICSAFGADGDVLEHATTYLRISALGIPFMLVTLGTQGVLRGASNYTTPLWILLASNVANLLIELLLVFGLDWGVAGSAWSTVFSQICAAIAFTLLVRPQLATAAHLRPAWSGMAPLMTAGRHLLLRVGSMLVIVSGSAAVAARIDDETLAAHQIGISLFLLVALSLDALAIPAQTLIAEDLGRADRVSAGHVARRAVVLSVWTAIVLAVATAALSPLLPRLFTDDDLVADRGSGAVLWLAVMMIPAAIAFAYDGVLIGAGDYRFLGRAALGYTVTLLPLAAIVLAWPQLGIAGIWLGITLWMCLRATVNHLRARQLLAP
jgi:putative MATE family efflux protein